MKASTIAAMVMAAAAASVATIVALKKAHEKKHACDYSDLNDDECTIEFDADDCCCDAASEETSLDSDTGCCSGGACSFGSTVDEEDDDVDQPVQIQMPEGFDDEETSEEDTDAASKKTAE